MKTEDKIREKFGTDPGFRVPDGYFDEVFAKIQRELPEREPRKAAPLTRWQRIKPYVYMAAMFAGIWCTMKMVTMVQERAGAGQVSLDNPPAMIAQAMSSPEVAKPVVGTSSMIIVDGASEDLSALESGSDASEAAPTAETAAGAEIDNEIMQDFNAAVNASDIDLAQLEKALDADTGDELYYML